MAEVYGYESGQDEISTKQRILSCAVNLFAVKGYTETSIRELADAAGLKGASIYSHFPSKNAILEDILEDYSVHNSGTFNREVAVAKLKKDSSIDGIADCFTLIFEEGKKEYYVKVLSVLLQEQHRNLIIHDFVADQIILRAERDVMAVFEILKDLNVIRKDADPDPWAKIHSSLLYAYSSRMMLGIGDNSPDYSGPGMADLVKFMLTMMLSTYANNG